MTNEDWQLALERLKGRMSLQESRHSNLEGEVLKLEKRLDSRLAKIEANTNRLVWILVTAFVLSLLTTVFGEKLELPRVSASAFILPE